MQPTDAWPCAAPRRVRLFHLESPADRDLRNLAQL